MRDKLNKIVHNDLIKVFSLTGISTLIKIISSYFTVKIVASIIGPTGIALIGQLQNIISILTTLGSGGINNGIVKYISENENNPTATQKYINIGLKITIIFSVFFSFLILVFSAVASRQFLHSDKYNYVFYFLGVSLMLFSLNNFLLSVINGFKDFKKFVLINIVTSLLSLCYTVTLVLLFDVSGALVATVTAQAIMFFLTLIFIRKYYWVTEINLIEEWDIKVIRQLASYSVMAIVSAAAVPMTQLAIRGYIFSSLSKEDAGFWEAINRVSGFYLMFITTSFSVYYLPKLSALKNKLAIRLEIVKTYKIIAPFLFITLLLIFFAKKLVILVLFSPAFYPMENLFIWQLVGDFFKIMSWLLAFIMVAKSITKLYIITEIAFSILLVVLSVFFIDIFGLVGGTISYAVVYFLYFITMVFIFRHLLFGKNYENSFNW